MRELLGTYDSTNQQTNALLKKLFLDKLPPQVRSILAGTLDADLNSIVIRADEILAVLNDSSNAATSSQKLINEIFDQRLNKLTLLLEKQSMNELSSQNNSQVQNSSQPRTLTMFRNDQQQQSNARFKTNNRTEATITLTVIVAMTRETIIV